MFLFQGDSGGPIIAQDKHCSLILVGVISFNSTDTLANELNFDIAVFRFCYFLLKWAFLGAVSGSSYYSAVLSPEIDAVQNFKLME